MKKIVYILSFLTLLVNFAFTDVQIAVVDEQYLIDKYDKSVSLIKKLEDKLRQEEQVMKDLEKRIISAKSELRIAGINKREKILKDMRKMEVEYKVNKEYITEMLSIQRSKYTMEVLKDIHATIKDYSVQKKIDLVVRKNIPGGARGQDPQKFVLYNLSKMDITEDILNILNLKYKQTK